MGTLVGLLSQLPSVLLDCDRGTSDSSLSKTRLLLSPLRDFVAIFLSRSSRLHGYFHFCLGKQLAGVQGATVPIHLPTAPQACSGSPPGHLGPGSRMRLDQVLPSSVSQASSSPGIQAQINKSVSCSSLPTICSPRWSPGSLPGRLQAPRSREEAILGLSV